jgi:hypothetical protein
LQYPTIIIKQLFDKTVGILTFLFLPDIIRFPPKIYKLIEYILSLSALYPRLYCIKVETFIKLQYRNSFVIWKSYIVFISKDIYIVATSVNFLSHITRLAENLHVH